jgi:hypothetical protein
MHKLSPHLNALTWTPAHKPKKSPNLNSPNPILFAIQRKTAEFPQNKKRHLATLFSVRLRVLPFSEFPPLKFQSQKLSNSQPFDLIFSPFSQSHY